MIKGGDRDKERVNLVIIITFFCFFNQLDNFIENLGVEAL